MLKDYLEPEIYELIKKNFSFNDITEIRLRLFERIIICIKNKKYFLKNNSGDYVIVSKSCLENFIKRISENSLYAFNENIINGFITLPNGVRVGLSGTVVYEKDRVVTIKDFQAANIRIPHLIRNCSLLAYDFLVDTNIKNTLIISAPGCGKTTFLKDLIYQLNLKTTFNLLIVDERNEISGGSTQHLGGFCDIYTNCGKEYAFSNGIRSMSPDVILTDEIDLKKDLNSLVQAINCGVKVVATIHAKDIRQLKNKTGFDEILSNKVFERFVVLTNDDGPGTITYIYDEKLNCLYCKN